MLSALYQSFYHPIIYWRAAHEWRTVKYILLLAFLSALSSTYAVAAYLPYDAFYKAAADFPVMTIQGGNVAIDRAQPYIVYLQSEKAGGKPEAFVIFDNTGTYTQDSLKQGQTLVTPGNIYIKKNAAEVESYSFQELKDGVITPDDVAGWISVFKVWAWPFMLILLMVIYLIGFGILMLLYGLIGIAIAQQSAIYLDYLQLMRIALVAMTPMVVVQAVLAAAGIEGVSFWLDMLVTLGYMVFGVRSARAA